MSPRSVAFGNLPDNVLSSILLFSDYKTIARMKVLSKRWTGKCPLGRKFWKRKYELDFGDLARSDMDYEKQYRLEYAWRFMEPKMTALSEHEDEVAAIKFLGPEAISVSIDASVRIWDLGRKQCKREVQLQYGLGAHSFNLTHDRVFGGMWGGLFNVWELSGDMYHAWQAHNGGPCEVRKCRDYLVTASPLLDTNWTEVKTWQSLAICIHRFAVDSMTCIHVDDIGIVCGCANGDVHLLDHSTRIVESFNADEYVSCICANAKYIFIGVKREKQIDVWDRRAKRRVAMLECRDENGDDDNMDFLADWEVRGMKCNEKRLVVALIGKYVYGVLISVWDVQKLACVRALNLGWKQEVSCMEFDEARIGLGFPNGHIKVIEFEAKH